MVAVGVGGSAYAQKPKAVGTATVRVNYATADGVRQWSGNYNFAGRGPMDALPLNGAGGKMGYMNSINLFGRRPLVPKGLRDDESVITNAFFKETANNRRLQPLFADIASRDTLITVELLNMKFDRRVELQADTLMLHVLWDIDQMDQLPRPYQQAHNHHTAEKSFRDFDHFFPNIFSDHPRNYTLGDLSSTGSVKVEGNGTHTLTLRVSFPYQIIRSLEEQGQQVPPHLPAPFGFLEPWHFHLEYAVRAVGVDTCAYTISKSRSRGGCGACPNVGEAFDSGALCLSVGDCARRLKTQIDCPNGEGTCKLRGDRDDCVPR